MSLRLDKITGLRWAVAALGLACLAVLAWHLIDGTGHDYSYFFPRMLDSYLFMKASGLAVQDYTASFCAGIFVFANPQSIALSVPQVLLFAVDPVVAIRLTYILFAVLGGAGIYLIARRLDMDRDAALVSAAAFAFSGHLITRMMVGHVAMHTIALAPLIAWLAMQSLHTFATAQRLTAAACLAGAALLFAAVVYSGGAALVLQMGAIVGILTLLYGIRRGAVLRALAALCVLALLAFALAAPKIEAGLALMTNLPKDYYSLPGFTVAGLLRFLAEGLFFSPTPEALNDALLDRTFRMGWHALYFGMTPFVLLLLVAPLATARGRSRMLADIKGNRAVVALGLACFVLVAALNIRITGWNEFLQGVPLLGNVNTLVRWTLVLVPLLALAAGRSASYWELPAAARSGLAAALVVAMTAFQLVVPPEAMKKGQNYDPAETLQAWTLIHDRDATPPRVTQIGMRLKQDDAGNTQAQWSPRYDHAFLSGASNALCYEPLFGYRLERYSFGSLRPGGIGPPRPDGTLNLKNPACYVYPEANGCAPGDHFREEQTQLVADLLDRKPVVLAASSRRKAADAAAMIGTAISAVLIGAALVVAAAGWMRRRRRD